MRRSRGRESRVDEEADEDALSKVNGAYIHGVGQSREQRRRE